MRRLLNVLRFTFVTVCGISITVAALAQTDDTEATRLTLKACVDSYMNSEKKQPRPSADSVLKKCKKEHADFIASLPPELATPVDELLKRDIQAQLTK